MQAFHIPGAAPLYTNTFLLISDAGHAVVIDPAADAQTYDKILKENNAQLTTILCTHGHYDHVGSAEALRTEWNAKLYCEAADLAGDRMYPLSAADCGYAEGGDCLGRRAAVHGLAHARPYARRRGAAVRRVSLLRRHPVCRQHRPYRSGGRQQCTDGRESA